METEQRPWIETLSDEMLLRQRENYFAILRRINDEIDRRTDPDVFGGVTLVNLTDADIVDFVGLPHGA
jgi:hypothetical protein